MNEDKLNTLTDCLFTLAESLNAVVDRLDTLADKQEALIIINDSAFSKMRQEFFKKVIEFQVNKEFEKNKWSKNN